MKPVLLSLLAWLAISPVASPAETEPARYAGLKVIQVGTEVDAVVPGETLWLGLFLSHEKGFHTYWKSPGVVGVPPVIEWGEKGLPEGFELKESRWPAPQNTLMASLNAWGYETDTTVLIPVSVPADLDGKEEVTLGGRIGWMCCATSCHPGWHDFSLTLPVAAGGEAVAKDEKWAARFKDSRSRFPKPAPRGWEFAAREVDEGSICLVVRPPSGIREIDWSRVYFFSDDNQVDSDADQRIKPRKEGPGAVFTFSRPDFAPENPAQLSGVLFLEDGWPGLGRHPWMIASAPWSGYVEPSSDGEREEE